MAEVWTITQKVDLARSPVSYNSQPDTLMLPGDNRGHTWRVEVLKNGLPVDIEGATITGYFLRSDGNTVMVVGSASGNVATVTLAQECYAYSGGIRAVMRCVKDGAIMALADRAFVVRAAIDDGGIIDPGEVIPSIDDLLAQIDAMEAATADAEAAASKAVRYDTAQELTDAQKAIGRGNIDAASVADIEELMESAVPVDGYDASNNSTASLTVRPFVLPTVRGITVTGIKINIATAGKIAFGVYKAASISAGSAYDAAKYERRLEYTFTRTGLQTVTFDVPVQVPIDCVFCVGVNGDTGSFKYGGYGNDKGFFYVASGAFTSNDNSLGITIYGKRSRSVASDMVSRYAGRKFSFLGDSITTFNESGYRIDGYNMYYPSGDVTSVEDTWFKQVLDGSGTVIEVNASWSGSRATNTHPNASYPDFYQRCGLLGNPDVIFVALGTNDSGNNIALGDYDFETATASLSEATFRTAYIKGVKALQANYPNAEIVLLIMSMGDGYADSIRHIGATLGAQVVDCRDYQGSGVHPGAAGMRWIASRVLYPVDVGLTVAGMSADAAAVREALTARDEAIAGKVATDQGVAQAGKALVVGSDGNVTIGEATGITDAVKVALLSLLQHVAYTDDQGQSYYAALYAALYQSPAPSGYPRLDVIYDNPSTITVDKSTMTKLGVYINNRHNPTDIESSATCKTVYFPCQPNVTYRISKVLSARYRVGYTVDVPASGVTIYGVIADNDATTILLTTGSDARYVAVYYYDSANDTLSESEIYNSLEVTYGGHVVYTDDALDTLKPYLTVKRLESAGDSGTLVTDYTLSGTLVDGLSTVLVRKDGLTAAVQVEAVDYYNQLYYSLSSGSLTKLVAGAVAGEGAYGGNISASSLNNLPGTRRSVWTAKGRKKITEQGTSTELDYYPIPIPDHATKAIITVTPNTQYVAPRVFRLSDNAYTSMQIGSWTQGSVEFVMNDIGTEDYLTVNMKADNAGSSYTVEPTEVTVTFVR